MRDRSDVTLLGARNSGGCNIDFQSVTDRQNPARALMPHRLTAQVTALTISAHGCPMLTNVSGAVRSTPRGLRHRLKNVVMSVDVLRHSLSKS